MSITASPRADGRTGAERERAPEGPRTKKPRKFFTGAPSNKVSAAALAGALATVLWILLAQYVTTDFSDQTVAALTAATTTIFAFAIGYAIPEKRAGEK